MNYCYARVSTEQQNLDRQILAFKPFEPYVLYTDKESGKNFDRTNYKKMKRKVKEGDTIIVLSLDRSGRNYDQIKQEWQEFNNKNIKIKVIDMPLIDTTNNDLTSKLISDIVLQLLSYVAQTEYEKIHERQAQGIEAAKAKGVKFGRPRKEVPEELLEKYKAGGLKAVLQDFKEQNISRGTFYRVVNEKGYLSNEHHQIPDAVIKELASQLNEGKITLNEIIDKYNYSNRRYLIGRLNKCGGNIKNARAVEKEYAMKKLEELRSLIEDYKINLTQVMKYCHTSGPKVKEYLSQMGVENCNCICHRYKVVYEDKVYKFATLIEAEKVLGFCYKTIQKHIDGEKNGLDRLGIKVTRM